MAKDPAFLFYPDNFMSGTMFMTNEQVGKYIRLLCAQHQTGHLKERDMMKICESYDEDIFSKFVKDEENRYYNLRLEAEIVKRKKYSESRSNNRKAGIDNQKKPSTYDTTYENHMGNGNININKDKDINVFNIFEQCGFQINGYNSQDLIHLSDDYTEEWVIEAIKIAADNGKKNMSYIRGILNKWQIAGAMDNRTNKGDQNGIDKKDDTRPKLGTHI